MKLKTFALFAGLGLVSALCAAEDGPLDWSLTPFSDQASHFVLLPQAGGLLHWQLRSAWALGSATRDSKPAKNLFDIQLKVQAEGNTLEFHSSPQWLAHAALETATAAGLSLSAEGGAFMPEQDCLVLIASLHNDTPRVLHITATWAAGQDLPGAEYSGRLLAKPAGFSLGADRGKLLGRKALESAVFLAGPVAARFEGPGAGNEPLLRNTERAVSGSFRLDLQARQAELAPGRGLRLALVVAVGTDGAAAAKRAQAAWTRWALPVGAALKSARQRWESTAGHLAASPDAALQPLMEKAALTLLLSEYGPRGALKEPLYSAAKGVHDDFFSVETALACQGWAELDMGKAEASLLQLGQASEEARRPVPPYAGEEMLAWEAGGLPVQAWVGWDLYRRDHDRHRAAEFFSQWSNQLLNQAAWWPQGGQAAGAGLYRLADGEAADLSASLSGAPQATSSPAAANLGLSSLVAWQMQAAAAAAGQAAGAGRAVSLQAAADAGAASILSAFWDASRRQYAAAPEGLWPFLLNLDRDLTRARAVLEALPAQPAFPLVPWKASWTLRALSLYGYPEKSQEMAGRILKILAARPALYDAYAADGSGLGAPGSAATAAAAMRILLGRYDQEALLLPDTKTLSGRIREIRSLDGAFYMDLFPPPAKAKAAQPLLSMASPQGGSILQEGAFILSVENPGTLTLKSRRPLDVSELRGKGLIFKGTTNTALILKRRVRYLFKFTS